MNKYENAWKLNEADFKRLTGIKKNTFSKMVEILSEAFVLKHSRGGRKPKLSIENQLMLTLEYYREYRTMFHISVDYGIAKSNVCEIINWVEEILVKDGTFSLPGKKVLLEAENDIKIVLVDVTECAVERPKKNKNHGIQEKRNAIQ